MRNVLNPFKTWCNRNIAKPCKISHAYVLHQLGTKTVLLTGDNRKTADYFAGQVGISEVRADLLPEEKVSNIIQLQKNGTVCMIGDGINDAPALKKANVGIAMGGVGSDIAVEDFA